MRWWRRCRRWVRWRRWVERSGASAHAIPADEDTRSLPKIHRSAIRRHKSDPPAYPVENHLVIAHRRGPDHGTVVLIVVDPEAPDAGAHFEGVLRGWHLEKRAASKGDAIRVELLELITCHCVAVVVRVFALGSTKRALAPWALGAEVVTCFQVGGGGQVGKRGTGVDDRAVVRV